MIKATKIEMTRAEGRREMDFSTYTFGTWEVANDRIADIAKTVEGHSDKVDFAIHFEDGFIYNGTICVTPADADGYVTLTDHIRDFLSFEMGVRKPAHLTEAQYADFIEKRAEISPDHLAEVQKFATTYRIG
jgi:hypothetical protein